MLRIELVDLRDDGLPLESRVKSGSIRKQEPMGRKSFMFKAISATIIGIGLLVGAAVNVQSTREFFRTSNIASGRVVRLNVGGYHPQIEFVTNTGERISYPQGGLISKIKEGDAVSVRYLADDPTHSATADVFAAIWDTPLVLWIHRWFCCSVRRSEFAVA